MFINELKHYKIYAAKKGDNIKRWHKQIDYFNAEYFRRILN